MSLMAVGKGVEFYQILVAVQTGPFDEKLVKKVEEQLKNLNAPQRRVLLRALNDRVKHISQDLASMLSKDVQKALPIVKRLMHGASSQPKEKDRHFPTEKSPLVQASSPSSKDNHSTDEAEENLFSIPNAAERYLLQGGDFEVLLSHFNARVEEIGKAVQEQDETTKFGYAAFACRELKMLIDQFQKLRHAASSMSYAASCKIANPGKPLLQKVLTRADTDIIAALDILTLNEALLSIFHKERLKEESDGKPIEAPKKGWREEDLVAEAQEFGIDYGKVIDIRLYMLNGRSNKNYEMAVKQGASLKPFKRAFNVCWDSVEKSGLNREHKNLLIERIKQRYYSLVMTKQDYNNAKDFNRKWCFTGVGFFVLAGTLLYRAGKAYGETNVSEARDLLTSPLSPTAVINTEELYQRLMAQSLKPRKGGIGELLQQHSRGKPVHPRILAIKLGAKKKH